MKYSELSDRAKEALRDRYRDVNVHDEWWESVYEDAKQTAEVFGLVINDMCFSGFCSQGDGASFIGEWHWKADASKAIREYAPEDTRLHQIVDELTVYGTKARLKGAEGWARATWSRGSSYCHENTMDIEMLTFDDDGDAVLYGDDTVKHALRDFARWIYRMLEAEYDHLTSDEQVDEALSEMELDVDEI